MTSIMALLYLFWKIIKTNRTFQKQGLLLKGLELCLVKTFFFFFFKEEAFHMIIFWAKSLLLFLYGNLLKLHFGMIHVRNIFLVFFS